MTIDTEKAERDATVAAQLSAETLGHDLLAIMVDELKVAPKRWPDMNQTQQAQTIERMREKVRKLLPDVLGIIFRGDYPACRAQLHNVALTDGVQAVLKMPPGDEAMNFVNAVARNGGVRGTPVMLVAVDAEQYLARIEEINAKADQLPLFEDDPGDGAAATDDLFAEPDADENPGLRNGLHSLGINFTQDEVDAFSEPQLEAARDWAVAFNDWLQGVTAEKPRRPQFLPEPDMQIREAFLNDQTTRNAEDAAADLAADTEEARLMEEARQQAFFDQPLVPGADLPDIYAYPIDGVGVVTVESIEGSVSDTIRQALERTYPAHTFRATLPDAYAEAVATAGELLEGDGTGEALPEIKFGAAADTTESFEASVQPPDMGEQPARPVLDDERAKLQGKLFAMRIEMQASEIVDLSDEDVQRGIVWVNDYTDWQAKPKRRGNGPQRPGFIPSPTE